MARRSIEIASFAHQNPIPAASRLGPVLVHRLRFERSIGMAVE